MMKVDLLEDKITNLDGKMEMNKIMIGIKTIKITNKIMDGETLVNKKNQHLMDGEILMIKKNKHLMVDGKILVNKKNRHLMVDGKIIYKILI